MTDLIRIDDDHAYSSNAVISKEELLREREKLVTDYERLIADIDEQLKVFK